jgi:hypothetical protein
MAFLLLKFFCAGTRSTSRANNQRCGGDLFHFAANILRRSMNRFIQLGLGLGSVQDSADLAGKKMSGVTMRNGAPENRMQRS